MNQILLGNLTVSQIEKEHRFSFTQEEARYLRDNHHPNATIKEGESGWHMFDLPPFLVVSHDEIGMKCLDIFSNHYKDYKYTFEGAYEGGAKVVSE